MVDKLTGGLAALARQRKVEVIHGEAELTGPHVGARRRADDLVSSSCIIAAGSRAASSPTCPTMRGSSTPPVRSRLTELPKRLLVVGGGIIGLEMARVYDALGSRVTVVELMDQLIPGCDRDLVEPLRKRIAARYEAIHLGARWSAITAQKRG